MILSFPNNKLIMSYQFEHFEILLLRANTCRPIRVVCGTVYGDMLLKDLLGSFVRVGYRIPVPDFYLVLHGLNCRKCTVMD